MKYPKKVQPYIDVLTEYYEVDPNLKTFDILHLYPGKLACPDGYYDSRWFELVGYNTRLRTKRVLGNHDRVDFATVNFAGIKFVGIYADKSTIIRLEKECEVGNTQSAYLYSTE